MALHIPVWRAEHSVGNALLDKQHILLLELTRSLVQHSWHLDARAVASSGRDILQLAQRHCAAEEQLMLLNGFARAQSHRQEHRADLERLGLLLSGLRPGPASEAFCKELAAWVSGHLLGADRLARDYLRHHPAFISPPD